MGSPFNSPNPYGGYFNFNSAYGGVDPTPSVWRKSNYPDLGAPTSAGVASAMGAPSEGFNPSTREFQETRRRDIAYQQFIDHAIKSDPRTRTVANMLLDGVYGNDARNKAAAVARVGGSDAYAGIIGTVMNTPGLSGYFGGAARSLALGSLAASTSGMTMNGYGIYGDKPVGMHFADALLGRVNQQFYGANGNPNLAMTSGLNRDQMGGLMVTAASQGAFNGLDMGKLTKLDQAGNNVKFVANEGSVQKITDFMKNASKALGSMIDVYGNLSTGELLQKMQQITGLDMSRLENASLGSDRLKRLRDTARSTGIDTASMFDYSARAADYGMALGLGSEMAGSFGGVAATSGARAFRARQQNFGTNFYTNTMSMQEAVYSSQRDLAGMSQDPLGARMSAMEMAIGNSGISGERAASLRSRASSLGASANGSAALDEMARTELGVSLPGMINAYGGPKALQGQLSPAQQERLAAMYQPNMRIRQQQLISDMVFQGGMMPAGSTYAQSGAVSDLLANLGNEDVESLLAGKGSASGLIRKAGFDDAETQRLLNSVGVVRGMGKAGTMAYRNARGAVQANPLTNTYTPESLSRKNAYMTLPGEELPDDFRGSLIGGHFVEGMMDKYSGNDPMSRLQWLNTVMPERLAGINEQMSMDFGSFLDGDGRLNTKSWRKNVQNWRHGLGRTEAGRALSDKYHLGDIQAYNMDKDAEDPKGYQNGLLNRFFNDMRDPSIRDENLSPFDAFPTHGGRDLVLATKADSERKAKFGVMGGVAFSLAKKLTAAHSGDALTVQNDANYLLTGEKWGYNPDTGELDWRRGRFTGGDPSGKNTAKAIQDAMFDRIQHGGLSVRSELTTMAGTPEGAEFLTRIKDRESQIENLMTNSPNRGKQFAEELKREKAAEALLTTATSAKPMDNVMTGPAGSGSFNLVGDLVLKDNGGGQIVAALQNVMAKPNAAKAGGK